MEENVIGKDTFRPRARIIKTIGEDLISSESVAILELVKNSYDADAKNVRITFEGDIENGEGKIIIEDNGSGMDLETLRKGWMEPATIIKKKDNKSQEGRRFLGEKGVGRFASAKLSKKLKIITKKERDKEVVAKFDWDLFSNEDKYLDEINCDWEVLNNPSIKNKGTVIELEKLNSKWDNDKLAELRIALSRLVNPLLPISDFEITLTLPEKYSNLSGKILSPPSLDKPDYKIKGKFDGKKLNMVYTSKSKGESEDIEEEVEIEKTKSYPSCGPFDFEFRVWDLESESLKQIAEISGTTLQDIKRDLRSAAGVSIYRDGFRVLPYGDQKNDWLRLDLRRVNNPTLRISNNQIVGYISISMDKNPELKDQSNREGIIESQEFEELKESIRIILSNLESRRKAERKPVESEEILTKGIFSDINLSPIIELVQRKIPGDAETTLILIKEDEKIRESVRRVQAVLSRYRRLSTLGQLIDTVLHDGSAYLSRTSNELLIIEKELRNNVLDQNKITKHFELIEKERQALANLFKRLEPFSGRRPKDKKEIILENSIKNVFELFNGEIKRLKVLVELPDTQTKIKINDQDVQTIILNLLQNSLYWLEKIKDRERKIGVNISFENDDLSIIFYDNGPGISESVAPNIFDPYYSTKPDGIGLGLTIAGELVNEYGGNLELVKDDLSTEGAVFRMIFHIQNGKSENIDG